MDLYVAELPRKSLPVHLGVHMHTWAEGKAVGLPITFYLNNCPEKDVLLLSSDELISVAKSWW